jgi:hypothetical protein
MKSLYIRLLYIIFLSFIYYPLFSQTSVFDPGIDNAKMLPSMIIEIDDNILAQSYISKEVYTAQEIREDDIRSQYYSSLFIEDVKVIDAKKILSRYLEKDLLSSEKETDAIIRLNVIYYDYNFNETAGAFINVFTFGIGNLLGIPNFRSRTMVELELQILNYDHQIIADYTATAEKGSYRGLYYRKKDERECNLLAIKRALNDLNGQLMQDYDKILPALE